MNETAIAETVTKVLENYLSKLPVETKEHAEDHMFLKGFRKKWDKIEGTLIGLLMAALLGSAALAFVQMVGKH